MSPDSQVVGPTKERMQQFEDTIKVRPPAHTMYHAARSYRIPNPHIAGKNIKWDDVYQSAAVWKVAREERRKTFLKLSAPAAPEASPFTRRIGLDEEVKRWNVTTSTSSLPTATPPPSYHSFPDRSQQPPNQAPTGMTIPPRNPQHHELPANPLTNPPRPFSAPNTHPPPHPHAEAYPSSPYQPSRVILPVPQSLRPDLQAWGFKTPRTAQTHFPIHDTGSYTTTSSEERGDGEDEGQEGNGGDGGNGGYGGIGGIDGTGIRRGKYPLPPPTDSSDGERYFGYEFVWAITDPFYPDSEARARKHWDKGKGKDKAGVKFESEVEVRMFGANEEPRRAARGREEVWKWMEAEEWGDRKVGKKCVLKGRGDTGGGGEGVHRVYHELEGEGAEVRPIYHEM